MLQSDRQDYGKIENPTYMLDSVIQSPPGTFGFMGIEKMYFQQPVLFPSAYLNTSMTITYSLFSTNASDILPANMMIASNPVLVSTDFSSTFTFDGIPYPVTLADIGFDGSGGYVLASILDCLLTTLNSKVVVGAYYNQAYPVFDFKCSLFTSWRALSNTTSTSAQISKTEMASAWLRTSCPPLSLFFKRTYATTSYVPLHEVETITVTLTDTKPQAGLVGRIFNIPSGTLTMSQTAPNPVMFNSAFLTSVSSSTLSSSTFVALKMNFGGINFIKVFCDMSQGFKAAHITLPGCVDTTLLGIIPVSGLPGNWEYYISPGTNERVAIHGATMDALTLLLTDELDRPLTAMNNYALVIGVDFIEREELARQPLMSRK